MEDFDHSLMGHQCEQGSKVDARGQCIDHDGFLGARHLHDAELGVIGALAQELGIDGHERVLCKSLADLG